MLLTERIIGFVAFTTIMLASPALSAQENASATPAAGDDKAEVTTGGQAPKKITDRRHPDYVRCRSQAIIGSLARKRRVCMTNREWTIHIQEGNKRANQFVNDIQGGMRTDVP